MNATGRFVGWRAAKAGATAFQGALETHVAARYGVRRQSVATTTLSPDRARSLVKAFNRQFDAQSGVALRACRAEAARRQVPRRSKVPRAASLAWFRCGRARKSAGAAKRWSPARASGRRRPGGPPVLNARFQGVVADRYSTSGRTWLDRTKPPRRTRQRGRHKKRRFDFFRGARGNTARWWRRRPES